MKRIPLLILFFVLVAFAHAQKFEYAYKNVQFKGKIENNQAYITSLKTKVPFDMIIPSTIIYNGTEYPVKAVRLCYTKNLSTVNLTLEEGIEIIDTYCFFNFRGLKQVTLPLSIRYIGKNAFGKNRNITITMPSSFDEQLIRKGTEVYAQGSNAFITVNLNKEKSEKKDVLINNKHSDTQEHQQPNNVNANTPPPKEVISVLPPVDVDIDIPVTDTGKNQDMFCVIIANEKYTEVPEVEYAQRDGEIFKEYCVKTLGIPEKQIRIFVDASFTDIKRALNWVETMTKVADGKSKVLFYYAGHGMPDEKDKTAYLIPTDGFPKDITTCFKLSELYRRLGAMDTQSVTVFLDACFSGVERGSSQALVAARGIAIKPKNEVLPGNMVVFTAASNDETALAYQEKRHGMFTYYLLNKLKETKGKVSFGELFTTISSEVKKNSMLENDKLQTPSVNVSTSLKQTWKNLHF